MSKNGREKTKRDSFFNLYFTSTISITLALFMVGLVAFLLLWANHTVKYTKENVVIALVLRDSIQQSDIQRVDDYLKKADFIKAYRYISKESALNEHINDLGDDPTEFLGYNPLKATIEINLKADYANSDSLKMIEPKLRNYNFIEDIVYQKDMISDLNMNVSKISLVLSLVALLFLIVTIILINNIIRISIYSKRFVINTMKLVGARAWFIRKPFLKRFVVNGLFASFFAIIGLFGTGYYVKQLDSTLPLYDWHFCVPIAGLVLITGFLISFLAALFAINRYIRMKTNEMYFI
ncbi:MAG: permease-like cell division protein FtsX [Prevotellaceae bacterium]|jgi:cell division transport system permease protein|nr:permease-like cell division protein FtsX [Prevotellaceae bacterium]